MSISRLSMQKPCILLQNRPLGLKILSESVIEIEIEINVESEIEVECEVEIESEIG